MLFENGSSTGRASFQSLSGAMGVKHGCKTFCLKTGICYREPESNREFTEIFQ